MLTSEGPCYDDITWAFGQNLWRMLRSFLAASIGCSNFGNRMRIGHDMFMHVLQCHQGLMHSAGQQHLEALATAFTSCQLQKRRRDMFMHVLLQLSRPAS